MTISFINAAERKKTGFTDLSIKIIYMCRCITEMKDYIYRLIQPRTGRVYKGSNEDVNEDGFLIVNRILFSKAGIILKEEWSLHE